MQYTDRVYGGAKINEPIILELIASQALQRLKGVNQAGYYDYFSPGGDATITRFEHSLGVFLLLKKYGASIEEQVAGLIHDASHSTFSHCIDYVLKEGSGREQSHQDNIFNNFIKSTDIPLILEKYNLDLEYILDDGNFPLKETELPDLCADRIDYSIRTAVDFNEISKEKVNYLLDNLIVKDSKWIFKDFKSGKFFAELFHLLNEKYYSGSASAVMFVAVGDCLRYALDKKYITKDDFYTTDKIVLDKIRNKVKKDKKLEELFLRMNNEIPFTVKIDTSGQVFCKSRIVDPLVFDKEDAKRVSDIDPSWKNTLKTLGAKQYFVEFSTKG